MHKVSSEIPTVSIIGFGRFGRTLYRLIKDDFAVTLFNRSTIKPALHKLTRNTKITESLEEAYRSDVIFLCTPIPTFESVVKDHKKYFKGQLLIDVLSVKLYPAKILKKYVKGTGVRFLLTHPMFGPDSSKDGFQGLPLVIDQFTATTKEYNWWKKYFASKQLRVVEMSADEHDRLAAYSQGLTHYISRILDEVHFGGTPIDTIGAKKLREVQEQVGHNTWELFVGLQNYNPHAKRMRKDLLKAFLNTERKLKVKRK